MRRRGGHVFVLEACPGDCWPSEHGTSRSAVRRPLERPDWRQYSAEERSIATGRTVCADHSVRSPEHLPHQVEICVAANADLK